MSFLQDLDIFYLLVTPVLHYFLNKGIFSTSHLTSTFTTEKVPMKKLLLLLLIVFLCSCSTRQVSDRFSGATEQRLLSHSVNDLAEALPKKDFTEINGKPVFLECHFLNTIEPVDYARQRLALELMDTYNCTVVTEKQDADVTLQVFFTGLGTDLDKFGLSLPEIIVPGVGALSSIDIIALEMFHGVSEMYYYFLDNDNHIILKGKPMQALVRNDTLKLPFISIPINTVK